MPLAFRNFHGKGLKLGHHYADLRAGWDMWSSLPLSHSRYHLRKLPVLFWSFCFLIVDSVLIWSTVLHAYFFNLPVRNPDHHAWVSHTVHLYSWTSHCQLIEMCIVRNFENSFSLRQLDCKWPVHFIWCPIWGSATVYQCSSALRGTCCDLQGAFLSSLLSKQPFGLRMLGAV